MPKKYFVTRHRGAITWASQCGVKARKIETENFDPSVVGPGDIVMGTLPVHLAAQVNARGGHYWHLSINVPAAQRGTELSAEQMAEYGARLEEYRLIDLGTRVSADPDIGTHTPRTGAELHICIASGETLANYIPLAALDWGRVRVYASKLMKGQAAHLQGMVEALARRRGLDATGICEVVPLPAKDDWRTLVRFAAGESAALSQSGISVDLNLSGGTKPMSMAFAEALQSQARRLYCATDAGELQFIDTLDASPTSLAPDLLDLPTYLAAQAWAIGTRVVDGDANATAIEKLKDLTASLVLSYQALNDTFAQAKRIEVGSAQPASPQRQLEFKPRSALRVMHQVASECAPVNKPRWPKPFEPSVRIGFEKAVPKELQDLFNTLQAHALVRGVNVAKPGPSSAGGNALHTLSFCWTTEAACTYAAGGYLEEYVWLCVQALQLPADYYGANVTVSPYDVTKPSRAGSELNELDIALVWNNRLLAVECKAGIQITTGKDQDIINKLDSIKDNMGGAKGQAWLVTPLEVKEQHVLERCKLNHITLMHGPTVLKTLAKRLADHIGVELAQAWPDMGRVKLIKAPPARHLTAGEAARTPRKGR